MYKLRQTFTEAIKEFALAAREDGSDEFDLGPESDYLDGYPDYREENDDVEHSSVLPVTEDSTLRLKDLDADASVLSSGLAEADPPPIFSEASPDSAMHTNLSWVQRIQRKIEETASNRTAALSVKQSSFDVGASSGSEQQRRVSAESRASSAHLRIPPDGDAESSGCAEGASSIMDQLVGVMRPNVSGKFSFGDEVFDVDGSEAATWKAAYDEMYAKYSELQAELKVLRRKQQAVDDAESVKSKLADAECVIERYSHMEQEYNVCKEQLESLKCKVRELDDCLSEKERILKQSFEEISWLKDHNRNEVCQLKNEISKLVRSQECSRRELAELEACKPDLEILRSENQHLKRDLEVHCLEKQVLSDGVQKLLDKLHSQKLQDDNTTTINATLLKENLQTISSGLRKDGQRINEELARTCILTELAHHLQLQPDEVEYVLGIRFDEGIAEYCQRLKSMTA